VCARQVVCDTIKGAAMAISGKSHIISETWLYNGKLVHQRGPLLCYMMDASK